MNRYANYSRNDEMPEAIGDGAFTRLDMQTDPATLAETSVQACENFRFDTQGARVRGGISRQLAPGDSVADILWVGVYRPHNSNDRLALLTSTAMELFNPADQSTSAVNFPGGETITAGDPVDFIQGGISSGTTPDAYVLRGLGKDALKYDGTSFATMAAFKRGIFGLFYQDRMAVASGATTAVQSQQVDVSDYLDFTTWTLLNQFKILYGGDDFLVGFMAYQKDYVIVGTRKRFFICYFAPTFSTAGYDGGLSSLNSFFRELTRGGGLVGRRAWMENDGLIWFVSDNGIYAFQPRLDLELTELGEPISAPIQPIMNRLSANYAGGADCKRYGYRLYFALPISDEPGGVSGITVANGTPNVATATTASAHNLAVGDTVQLTGAMDAGLNGIKTVLAVATSTTFTYATTAVNGAEVGERVTAQRIATRNNRIAVFNLKTKGWESVDTMPAGMYADFLVVADYGARRRLWVVDKESGPALYEEGDVDEVNTVVGGLLLPFYLPAHLTSANYNSVRIAGYLKSRAYRFGPSPRKVRATEVRVTAEAADSGTITSTVQTPDRGEWTSTRTFDGTGEADTAARKRCGRRGLEVEVEIESTAGRPTVRSILVETAPLGRVAEE